MKIWKRGERNYKEYNKRDSIIVLKSNKINKINNWLHIFYKKKEY